MCKILSNIHIILNEKACSVIKISKRSIKKYNNDNEVIAIICSRDIAMLCKTLNFPNLKLIQLTSVGTDDIDLNFYKDRNVYVANAGDAYNETISEFVIYSLLMSSKKYHRNINLSHNRLFRKYDKYITNLSGKTIGIMGVGGIGSEVAKRAKSFNMKVLGYSKNTQQKLFYDEIYHIDTIHNFISQCDYIITALPKTPETIGLMNKAIFSSLKRCVTIINVGRQIIFNKKDFLKLLRENKDITAILDMFEIFQNPITNPFLRLSNAKVLPGVTAISKESNLRLIENIKVNINNLLYNQPLNNVVNE